MIRITKLNDKQIVINSELILTVEATPDTTITMTTGQKFIARESVDDIVKNVIEYKQMINNAVENVINRVEKVEEVIPEFEEETDIER